MRVGNAVQSDHDVSSPVWALMDTGLSADDRPESIRLIEQVDLAEGSKVHPHGAEMAKIVSDHVGEVPTVSVRILDESAHLKGKDTLEAALDWLLVIHQRLNIRVVLLPVATLSHEQHDGSFQTCPVTMMVRRLAAQQVFIVCPAGNAFSRFFQSRGTEGMAWPAILRETISVGATTRRFEDGHWLETIAPHSQRLMSGPDHPGTTIFAPDPAADLSSLSGPLSDKARTSGAAALVSAIIINRLRAFPQSSHQEMISFLQMNARALPPARRMLRLPSVSYPAFNG